MTGYAVPLVCRERGEEHRHEPRWHWAGPQTRTTCTCGGWEVRGDNAVAHLAHVAAALAPVIAQARAEALREASHDPMRPGEEPYMTDWLRERADRIEGAHR